MNRFTFTWENAFFGLLWVFLSGVAVTIICFFFVEKHTYQYSLGSKGDNTLTITKEVEWSDDEKIVLDRSVSYSEAIRMVDSLNKTLK